MPKFSMRTWLIFALVGLLCACSALRLSYNHADTVVYWWLDGYIDVESEQAPSIRKEIAAFHGWHRKTQLQDYIAVLQRAQSLVDGQPQAADVQALYRDVLARGERLAPQLAPSLATLARQLRPEQIRHLEDKFAKNNADYRKKWMDASPEKRQRQRFESLVDNLETLYGNLSKEQEAQLRPLSDARPLNNDIWLAQRQERQKHVLTAIQTIQRDKLGQTQAQDLIAKLLKDEFSGRPMPEYQAFSDAYADGTIKVIVAANALATPAQKQHARERLQTWMADLKALASE